MIVKWHLKEEFQKIPEQKLIDIIPCIIVSDPEEMSILNTWENHFQSKKVPYCLDETTRFVNNSHRHVLTLWKEKISE